MQRMVERQERLVRLAEGEFSKLRKRRFESMEEFVHTVDAEQPQLLHESATVFRACEAIDTPAGPAVVSEGSDASSEVDRLRAAALVRAEQQPGWLSSKEMRVPHRAF